MVVGLTRGEEIAPLGGAVWEDSRLLLPSNVGGQSFRNVLTGEAIASEPHPDGGYALPLARVFAAFPMALLERTG